MNQSRCLDCKKALTLEQSSGLFYRCSECAAKYRQAKENAIKKTPSEEKNIIEERKARDEEERKRRIKRIWQEEREKDWDLAQEMYEKQEQGKRKRQKTQDDSKHSRNESCKAESEQLEKEEVDLKSWTEQYEIDRKEKDAELKRNHERFVRTRQEERKREEASANARMYSEQDSHEKQRLHTSQHEYRRCSDTNILCCLLKCLCRCIKAIFWCPVAFFFAVKDYFTS